MPRKFDLNVFPKSTTIVIASIYMLLLWSCEKKQPLSTAKPPPPLVIAVTAIAKDVPLYIDTLGRAQAYRSVDIVSQVDGQIVDIAFKQGSIVHPGDKLIEIYKPPYEAAYLQAKGRLDEAIATLENHQLLLERSRPLLPQKLISEQDFQSLETTVRQNEAAVATARGQVLATKVKLGYTNITSPIKGMIGLYEVNLGNVVDAQNSKRLTTIQTLNPMYVDCVIPIAQFHEVKQYYFENNKHLKIKASALSNRSQSRIGSIAILGNAVQAATATVNLRAILKTDDFLFWPQQALAVRIYLKTLKNAILIPGAALGNDQKGPFVFVIDSDHTVQQTYVEVGQDQADEKIVISNGLKAGDQVVVDGQMLLNSGMKVALTELDGKKIPVKDRH